MGILESMYDVPVRFVKSVGDRLYDLAPIEHEKYWKAGADLCERMKDGYFSKEQLMYLDVHFTEMADVLFSKLLAAEDKFGERAYPYLAEHLKPKLDFYWIADSCVDTVLDGGLPTV